MVRPSLPRRLAGPIVVLALLTLVLPAGLSAGPVPTKLDPRLLAELASAPDGRDSFLVFLRDQADLEAAPAIGSRVERITYVHQSLRATAERSQAGLRADLQAWGVPFHPFFIVNAIQVTGDVALARRLAARPEVARIVADPSFNGLDDPPAGPPAPPAMDAVEWNIARLQAPEVWALGYTGQGIVVGSADTGVEYTHPALVNQYRGNLGGGNFDHNYNWHDTFGEYGYPADPSGHGTHTTGTMVGDDGVGNQVGMAPGAKWIGCKLNSGSIWKASKYIECWEFFLAPTDLNGQNPRPDLAAHIINNSWSCPGGEGCDLDTLLPAAQALYAAGIAIAKSGGNAGPACGTITNPGQYEELLATAAFAQGDTISSFSSRGPVSYQGETRVKPDIAAPGSSIRSATPGGGYGSSSGTSMASPHTAGLIALLWSAQPALIGDLGTTFQIVKSSAELKVDTQCPPNEPDGRPNNVWGWGILNALQAVQAARGAGIGTLQGVTYDSAFTPIAGVRVEIVQADNGLGRSALSDPTGFYSTTLLAAAYSVTATHYGYLPATASVVVPSGTVTPLDLVLDIAASWALSGTVTDQGSGAPLRATLTLLDTPVRVATDPASGFYSATVAEGTYTLWADSPGYISQVRAITVSGNLSEDFALEPQVTYYIRDNTTPCGPAFNWIDITVSGQAWNLGDDASQFASLGGPSFSFYGNAYGSLYLGSNGQVVFGASAGANYSGGNTVPATFLPNNAIYAFWDDLNPASGAQGTVYTQLVDDDLYVIEYYQVQHFPSGSPETFEVLLDLGSGAITLQYLEVSDSRWTTVGIENGSGTAGFSYAFHDPAVPSDGLAVIFYPIQGQHPAEPGLGLLEGTVVASGTLTPIAGAHVGAAAWAGGFFAATTTDATGAYSLPLCADLYTVTADAAGYYPDVASAVAVYSGSVTVQGFSLQEVPQCQPVQMADFSWQPRNPTPTQVLTLTGWAGSWLTETVDPAPMGWVNADAMVLDGAGRPVVAYSAYHGSYYLVNLASYDGSAWTTQTVDLGAEPSLALDAAGRPHLSYIHDATSDLVYAFWDGSAWVTTTLDNAGGVPYYASLVLDASGYPHIGYFRATSYPYGQLRYAYHDGTAWQAQEVAITADPGGRVALALDASGRPHIAYHDGLDQRLQHAWHDGTAWQVEMVGDEITSGAVSLALDAADGPAISYLGYAPSGVVLRLAHYDGTAWQIETVDAITPTGASSSLALDGHGRPHISYLDNDRLLLKYAHHDGSAWQIRVLDPQAAIHNSTSLALDASGRPHVAFRRSMGAQPWISYAHIDVAAPTPPITYTWNLGDGSSLVIGPSAAITHSYSQPGTYTVFLSATNCLTATALATHTLTVAPLSPPIHTIYLPIILKALPSP